MNRHLTSGLKPLIFVAVLDTLAGPLLTGSARAEGLDARSAASGSGPRGAFAGRQHLVTDGQGTVAAGSQRAFSTESGAQGQRSRVFSRSADGSVNASGRASASGANGSAQRSGSFTRSADGSASGERSTTATNRNTGVTFDGSTTYTQGSGISRSASCTDASGNTVGCGAR